MEIEVDIGTLSQFVHVVFWIMRIISFEMTSSQFLNTLSLFSFLVQVLLVGSFIMRKLNDFSKEKGEIKTITKGEKFIQQMFQILNLVVLIVQLYSINFYDAMEREVVISWVILAVHVMVRKYQKKKKRDLKSHCFYFPEFVQYSKGIP